MSKDVTMTAVGPAAAEERDHGECKYNYVVTAHKPTAVSHSVVGSFTSPEDTNLIIAKTSRIEVHTLTPGGLQGVIEVPIYGRIATLELFRPEGATKDWMFVSTEKYKFCVLEYDSDKGELVTRANGDVSDKVGRPSDSGQMGIIDPSCSLIGLHLYDGLFKVIPIGPNGELQDAYNIRLEELQVLSVKFLHGCESPTVAILYEDGRANPQRHLKTYVVNTADKEFAEGPWQQSNVDTGAGIIIAVPAPLGGVIIVGESTITYYDGTMMKTAAMPQKHALVKCCCAIDADGSRYLLGDLSGQLHLLVLAHDGARVLSLAVQAVGTATVPRTLAYLDSGVVYLGSCLADSQLVKLHEQPVDEANPDNYVEVLEDFINMGPIIDFALVDLDKQGQGTVVTCSGAYNSGSLRLVRHGIGITEQAAVDLPGIRGMWGLKEATTAEHDKYLVLTFVGETRLLAINESDELDEAELEGFDCESMTLLCANVVEDQLLQITTKQVRVVDAATRQLVCQWTAPAEHAISVASASPSQALIGTGGGNLVYLEIGKGVITERAHKTIGAEIACVDITPFDESAPSASIAAVGTWSMEVQLLGLPDLTNVGTAPLGGDVIPRSVLLASFEGAHYLLLGLGDGSLHSWGVDEANALSDRKRISLGTKPITLRTFRSNGTTYVFAASDRPTVIYSNNKKLLYSNLNENDVNYLCSFNSASFPDSLALAKEDSMLIGVIDAIQKLHIRTVPIGEHARRIAYQEETRSFGLITVVYNMRDFRERGHVRIFDDSTLDVCASYDLDHYETGCSIASVTFAGDSRTYFVVGTALARPEEQEPKKGRILVLAYDRESTEHRSKLTVVAERETKGAVYNVLEFQGKLLCSVNSRVHLLRWTYKPDDEGHELETECSHHGHILALYLAARGQFVLVGDLMKSVHLLLYRAEEGVFEERARDFDCKWTTAVEMLDDDVYLGAENSFNLFTVMKNSEAATDEERNKLDPVGKYHLGDFVNRVRRGCLVMRLPDGEWSNIPTFVYATISGAIGVIACLPRALYEPLVKLQSAMRGVVHGVGGLDHVAWRAFVTERVPAEEASNFIDGDLVEQFLDLGRESMAAVASDVGDTTVDELLKLVEDLSRLH